MWTTSAQAQTTITTTFANNNGSSVVVFSVQNNNPYAIIMTDIGSHAGVTSTYTCYLYAKAATYNVAPGAAGAITAANGWSVVASNSSLSLPANTSGTGSTASPFITGMSYTIPAMTQVRLALQLATGAGLPPFTTTAGSLRYSTVSGTCSFTGAGVDLNSCASYGYGGTLSSPTNTPRGLVGYISFIPAVPCTGTPTPGNTTANVNPVCPSSSFTLGLQNPSNGSGVTYQWQSSPDNITYTNISGATSASYALTQSVDTWYQCIVTCTNSGQTTTSNPLQVTTNPFYNCYCTSTATSTADEDILNVTFGSLNNTSTCSTTGTGPGSVLNMYSNYRSGVGAPAAPSVMQGDVVPLSLGLGTCGGSYPNTAKVFIDWNQNGLFTDAGEEVYVSTSGSGARTVTGSVTVPLSAVPGNTAMRVVFVETSTPVPCGTYTWGETEDYLINVVATSACSGAPVAGTASGPASICPSIAFTVSTSGATVGTGISGQWYSSTDGGSTWSPISGATSTSYNVAAGISVPTMYQYVITCSNSGLSATSNNISIAVNPVNACYCTPTSTSATYGITNLTTTGGIANINNTSPGGQGYVDNTAQAVSQLQGSSVNFSYTVVPTEGVGIWIDWNQNGSFLDAGEQVYSSGGSYVSSGSGTISVSLSQPAGNYRMRIVGNWLSTSPTPCGDLGSAGYGEAEDYTFTVIPLSNCSGTPAPGNTLSNPATACIGQNINLSLQNSVVGAGITFDWQSSPDGVTWTSTGGTLPSYTTTQSAATWYQCIVTCTNSGQSATSTPVQVTMSPFYNCYCTTGLGGSCAINSLSSVAIATTTLNNVTGGCTGTYNSFPASGSTTASLLPGVPYTMTAGCISGSNTQVAIWIDYNQNGIFETTEYTLINGNIPSGGTGSGTFTIPVTALSGNTGMRVRSDWQGTTAWTSADACTNRTWGETEDYTITVLVPNSCSGAPASSATTSSASGVCPGGSFTLGTNPVYTDAGLTFDWQSSPDGITYTSTGVTTQSYTVTSYAATTWYQCVVTCTNGGLSTTSTPIQVLLNPFYNCYCTTSLHSSSTPCINEIDLNTLSNNTAAAGCALPAYSFQSATTNVLKGSTYTFTRVASGTGAWTGLWIDYDHSGTFDASEYTEISSTSTGALTNSISLTIPMSALSGNTGMRIRQRTVNMTASDACTQNFGSGETEDYVINIQTPAPCSGTPAAGNTISSAPSACVGVPINLTISTTYALSGITYQWQSSTDGVTYTNTSGTLPTYSATQSVTTWYQCVVTCTNSGLSITTTPVQVLQNLPNNCYCTPTSTSATYGITNFTTTGGVTNINNTSTGGQGYVNNTAQVVSQLQGSSVNFSYTVVPTEGVGIWIDWNQNGSFLDAGEQVYSSGGSYVSSGSGTISVSLSQPAGNYRMRIVGNWLSTSPTPCGDLGSAGYGEAEDYTINVIPLTNCTGTPSPGNTLSDQASVCSGQNFTLSLQNNVVATGITFDWQSSPDGVTWTSTGGTLPSYTTTQSATTWYQCIVTCTLSGQSATSTPVQVTMNPIASCYCVAGATTAGCSSGDEYIGNVTLNTINNTSTCQPSGTQYTDFTAISTNLIIGDTYVASVLTPNYFGGDQAAIWIDFNQNGTFEVPAEQFILSGGASGVPFTGNITIPGSALTGNTRMRVRMAYTGTLAPCGIVTYGEVEDYTVNISPSTCVMAPTYPADAGSGCADAVTGNIALSWPALSGATGY
ncbi:MAG TPA: GEVED domain-containing protein, partial [Bacteroidia bacterium]|nr:GEVED domain-containing protein [Bacteroidia bacterium]